MATHYKVKTIATKYNTEHEPGYSPHAVTYDSKQGAEREVKRVNAQAWDWYEEGITSGIPYYAEVEEIFVDERTPQEILDALRQEAEWAQNDRNCDWIMHDRLADIIDLADDLQKKLGE